MKTKIIQCAVIVALIGAIMAFTTEKSEKAADTGGYAYVTIIWGMGMNTIVIAYPDGQSATEQLGKFSMKPEDFQAQATKVSGVLNKLSKEGYKIVSSNGGDNISRFVFSKE